MSDSTNQATEWSLFLSAVMFYTRLPTPTNAPHSEEILNRSRKYFPAIGLIIGLLAAATFYIAHQAFSHGISVLFMIIATVLATGAFHEDGFADSCDGVGGGWSKEQVLTIMKDSRVGTYATVGILLLRSLKFMALWELSSLSFSLFASLLITAHVISRKISSMIIEYFDYVQDIDVSKVKPITDRRLNKPDLMVSSIISVLVLLFLAVQALSATVSAAIAAILIGYLFANYSRRRIGGYTGDVLGAIQQLAEMFFYLGFLALL